MTVDRATGYLISLIHELRKLPSESEWVEFKHREITDEFDEKEADFIMIDIGSPWKSVR